MQSHFRQRNMCMCVHAWCLTYIIPTFMESIIHCNPVKLKNKLSSGNLSEAKYTSTCAKENLSPIIPFLTEKLLWPNNFSLGICSHCSTYFWRKSTAQDLVFFLQNQVPIRKAKKSKRKKDVKKTKSTAVRIRTHDLWTVRRRPNVLTMQDSWLQTN